MERRILRLAALIAILSAALVLTAPAAWADTVSIDWDGSYSSGYKVKIGYFNNAYGNQANYSWNGPTVEFNLEVDGIDTVGYCVDIFQAAGKGQHDYESNLAGAETSWMQAAWMMDQYSPTIGTSDEPGFTDYDKKTRVTALQLAIWEVIYDTNYDLSTGHFRSWKVDPKSKQDTVFGLASAYLASLPTSIDPSSLSYSYLVAESCKYQDLLVPGGSTPSGGTPEPGTFFLMGSAALGLGWYRRRAAKKHS